MVFQIDGCRIQVHPKARPTAMRSELTDNAVKPALHIVGFQAQGSSCVRPDGTTLDFPGNIAIPMHHCARHTCMNGEPFLLMAFDSVAQCRIERRRPKRSPSAARTPQATCQFLTCLFCSIGRFNSSAGNPFHRATGRGIQLPGHPAGEKSQPPRLHGKVHGFSHSHRILRRGDSRIQQHAIVA